MSETEYISKQLKLLDSVDHEISSLHDTNSRLVQILMDVQGHIVECAHSRNELTAENARLKEELRDVMGSNARLKTALRAMMDIAASNTDYCHNNQSSRKPIDWDVPYHALSNIWERGREALAAERGAK